MMFRFLRPLAAFSLNARLYGESLTQGRRRAIHLKLRYTGMLADVPQALYKVNSRTNIRIIFKFYGKRRKEFDKI